MKLRAVLLGSVLLCGCARHSAQSGVASPSVWDVQVKNAVRLGDGDASLRDLRAFVLEHPKDAAARRRLADRFLAAGHRDLAIEHLRIAAELTPADESLALELARHLASEDLRDEASRALAAFRQAHSASAVLLSHAGILEDEQGNLAAGEALHRAALAKAPLDLRLRNNVAVNLAAQKKAGEAEALYREILAGHPSYEPARNNLAQLYAEQLNKPEEALLHWKAASGPAIAHNNLAAVYLEQNRLEEARVQLEKALTLRFQFPEAQRNLRLLASRTGGTVPLNFQRDKDARGLAKLARAFRQAFVTEDAAAAGSKR
jgi:tetratricopeptide (TPR) repeat protein